MLTGYLAHRTTRAAFAVIALLVGFAGIAHAQGKSPCRLPASLSVEVDRLFPGYSVVTQRDLRQGDRSRFRSDHKDSCPGLVGFDFYGNGKPTFGLALFKREGQKMDVKLVVATQPQDPTWSIREVDTADLTAAPVIWMEPPQEFKDVRGERKLKALHPALIFAQYESWAIVYAWNGAGVEKVWVSD